MALATAPSHDPALDQVIASAVATALISRVAGQAAATNVGKRMPVTGGIVGAGVDGYTTWRVGRYADRELQPRRHAGRAPRPAGSRGLAQALGLTPARLVRAVARTATASSRSGPTAGDARARGSSGEPVSGRRPRRSCSGA